MGRVRRDRKLILELKEFIVAAIDDATARITADVDKLIAALQTAQGGGTTDTANAAALNAASDRAEAALSPPAPTTGAPTAADTAAVADAAGGDTGALTAPA